MDFGSLLERVKNSFTNPSVLGNVIQRKSWNQDLPRFGGVAPESQMIQNPDVASPLQAPDEMTSGMIHAEQMEAGRPKWVPGIEVPNTGGQPVITPESTPEVIPTPEVLGAQSPDSFEELVVDVMNRNQIPVPVGLGIAQAEGGRIGTNNPFNINAVDSNPDAAYDYPTLEAGIQSFADLINKSPRYREATGLRDNPDAMLEAIQNAGYAGDPRTWQQRSAATGGAGRNGVRSWADFVKSTKGYKRFSQ